MPNAVWTVRAERDLRAFVAYLREQREGAAARASADLLDAADLLARRPALGRVGRMEGTREFSMPRWSKIIVYEVRNGVVVVLSLRDPRRQSG